jgi:hypothetical protein
MNDILIDVYAHRFQHGLSVALPFLLGVLQRHVEYLASVLILVLAVIIAREGLILRAHCCLRLLKSLIILTTEFTVCIIFCAIFM